MNQSNMNPENSAHWRDLLISRVIDGSASAEDWSSFRALASSDAEVWVDLSEAQREHEALCEVMNAAAVIADGVDLPGGIGGSGLPLVFESRVTLAWRWGGWAIAGVLLIGWFTGTVSMNSGKGNGVNTAGIFPTLEQASPEEAFGRYLQAGQSSGRVVGEMPNQIVIETLPLEDGTIEVTFIRQVVERRVLDTAYREAVDEFGHAVVVPVDLHTLKNTKSQ